MTARPPKIPHPAPREPVIGSAIERLRAALAEATDGDGLPADDGGDAARLVDDFWRSLGTAPLVEGSTITFLWRSATASRVLLFANRLTDETAVERTELERIPGTDIWHLGLDLPEGWRGSYGFLEHRGPDPAPWSRDPRSGDPVDQHRLREMLDGATPDPLNPRGCPNRTGHRLSVAELPDAPAQHPLIDSAEPFAQLSEATGPDGRRCWISDGGPSAARGPAPRTLWFVLDGAAWAERYGLGSVLAAMGETDEAPPLCAVLLDAGSTAQRWQELGDPADFCELLAERYLPWARDLFGEEFDARHCGIAGQSIGGLTALHCGTRRADVFGRVIAQSASLWKPLPDPAPRPHQRYRIEIGSEEWALLEPNRRFVRELVDADARVDYVEYAGGHDYACWRGSLPEAIAALS